MDEADTKVRSKMTARDRLDITEKMISDPFEDYRIIRGNGYGIPITIDGTKYRDPGGIVVVTKHLAKVWLKVVPAFHSNHRG